MKNQFWAVGCGLDWTVKKRGWADYEQLLRPVFSLFRGKKKIEKNLTPKHEKNILLVAHNQPQTLLFHSPGQTAAHSPELIFHIMKSQDQTSVP